MNDSQRAQGIHCAGLALALPYSWARSVVDDFAISAVPNAPAWLVGAANVEGRIVAVVDLHAWAEPAAPQQPPARQRLLLGGDGSDAFALRFEGLPALLHNVPPGQAALGSLPAALQPFVRGAAQAHDNAPLWPVLDIQGLADTWAAELAD